MKKILLMFGAVALSSGLALSQCALGTQYQGGTAPAPGGSTSMTSCAYASEYQEVLAVVAGNDYTVTYTGGASNFVTIFDATFTAVAWGVSPVSFTAASSGIYYSQPNLDNGACGTDTDCHTGTWANTSPPPPCPAVIAPWIETFETAVLPACWTEGGLNAWEWGSQAIGGFAAYGASGVLDYSASGTGTFIGMDGSNNGNGEVSELTTPFVDVTALTTPEVLFAVFSNNINDAAQNLLEVEIWDGAAWQPAQTIQGNLGNNWVEYSTVLGTGWNITGDIQVRFTVTGVSNGGSTYYNDILIDDVEVRETPTCPQPTGLALTGSDLTSATFSWNPGSTETQWTMEYGAPGFTPGTGTSSLVTNNLNETVTGIPTGMFYEMYVRAACTPGDTSFYAGPVAFNTFNQGLYMDADTECGPGFTDISTTGALNTLGDDGEVGTAIPFTLLYQGTPYSDITIGSNGALVFGSTTAQVGFSNGPMGAAGDGLYPFWDDLGPENNPSDGVYFQTIGTAPNQQFIVQWNKPHLGGNGQAYIFQALIDQATNEIYYLYNTVAVNDASYDYGVSATVGIAGPNQDIELSFNDSQYLTDNSCAHFFYTDCPNPTNFTLVTVTPTDAGITWDPGLALETNWTIIYGLSGFDPAVSGTTITSSSNVALLTGLTDITDYDVYIFADCNPGTLQSVGGLFGTFSTPPNCSDITGLNAGTAVDSLFTDWLWTESSGVGTYPSTGFNVQYGPQGFNLYTGTVVASDNNFTDTTFDATFLAGGVYEVYVQAICGQDTSNFVGPVTFTMPLTNDSTCLAETLQVDGVHYSFDNTGATTQANEITVAPPTTGYNTTDGWGDANLTFTTWFTFDAPASGSVYVSGKEQGFDGQIAIYEATDCADFATYTLVAANDDALDFTSAAPDFSVCGLTPGNTYYLLHDSWSQSTTGIYSISLREIIVEAGTTTGILEVCTGDTVNLFDGIAGQDAGGVWDEIIPTANFADSIFPTAGLAYQVFDFNYVVTEGCAADTSLQQVQIYGPSSAGNDSTLSVCQNEPLNLLNGLSGNVDLGGTWFDPSNAALPGADITASGIAGSFNYDYITDNGVCPQDTANVEVIVSPSCDFLNTEELFFGQMSVFPNPTNGVVNIANFGSTEVFSYEVTDLKGSVISGASSAIEGSTATEIDLGGLETGIYLIKVYNDSAEKTFRIVLQ